MATSKRSARKHGAKELKPASGNGSRNSTELRATPQVSFGLEDLDEETLLSLSLDTPVQLTPPHRSEPLVSESPPTPVSKMCVSNEVMAATLELLGFGPPNDLSSCRTLLSPTPENSESSITGANSHEKKLPILEPSCTNDAYGQINEIFQQIAQRTGNSVDNLILEWALHHARTDTMKRQQVFEEEVNKAINLVRAAF
jgi:hypothetical protein